MDRQHTCTNIRLLCRACTGPSFGEQLATVLNESVAVQRGLVLPSCLLTHLQDFLWPLVCYGLHHILHPESNVGVWIIQVDHESRGRAIPVGTVKVLGQIPEQGLQGLLCL